MSAQAARSNLNFTWRGQTILTSHFACLSKCESVTNLICSLAFVCQTLKPALGQKEGYSTISGTVKYLTSSIKMLFRIILSYFYSFTRCCFLSNTDISLLLPTSKIPPSNAIHPVVAFSGEGRPASLLLMSSDLAATDFNNTVGKYYCTGYVNYFSAEQFMEMHPAHPLSFQAMIF